MAIYVDWRVVIGKAIGGGTTGGDTMTLGVPDNGVDISDRVRSVEVDMAASHGSTGSSSAEIVIDNSDGAFTPFGGGAYEDWDWIANPVWVQAKTGTNPASLTEQYPLFGGFVSDVRYLDDGFSSTVTLSCDDPGTYAARSVLIADWDNFLNPIYGSWNIVTVFDINNYTAALPRFGGDADQYGVIDTSPLGTQPQVNLEFAADTGTNVGDIIKDIAATEYGYAFPWLFAYFEGSTTTTATYVGLAIIRNWLWGGKNATGTTYTGGNDPIDVTFVEGTPTGTELPFKSPTVGFAIDTLINSAACQVAGGGAVLQEAENAASVAAYGPRTVELTSLLLGYDSEALDLAEHLVNRYSTVDFGVTGVTVTGAMIQAKCADTALDTVSALLQCPNVQVYFTPTNANRGLRGPLYQPTFIEFTGAGGVDLSSRITFLRASYRITPDDWELTLSDGRSALDAFAFVIGKANYGVLGTNKLG